MYNTLFVGFGAIAYGLGLDSKYVAENPIPSHFAAVKDTGMGVVTCAVEPSVKRASEARGAGVKRVAATVKDLPNLDEIKVVSKEASDTLTLDVDKKDNIGNVPTNLLRRWSETTSPNSKPPQDKSQKVFL